MPKAKKKKIDTPQNCDKQEFSCDYSSLRTLLKEVRDFGLTNKDFGDIEFELDYFWRDRLGDESGPRITAVWRKRL